MKCVRCGFSLNEGDQFCEKCGAVTGLQPIRKHVIETNQENIETISNANTDLNGFGKSKIDVSKSTDYEKNIDQAEKNNTPKSETNKNNNTPKKEENDKRFIKIITILAIILVGLAVLIAIIRAAKEYDDDDEEQKSESKTISVFYQNITENQTNTISNQNSDSKTVTFKEFKFEIPEEITYQIENDNLLIANEDEEWIAQISIIEGKTLDDFKEQENITKESLQENGITTSIIKTQKYSGLEYIAIEAIYDNTADVLISICEANEEDSFEINIFEEYNYEALREIVKILSTVKYTGKQSSSEDNDEERKVHNLKIPNSINIEKIHEALKNN